MNYFLIIVLPFVLAGCGSDMGTSVSADGEGDSAQISNESVDADNENESTDTDTDFEGSPTDTTGAPGAVVAESSARYRLSFDATWSAETHAQDFPGNAHLSGLAGAKLYGSIG